MIRTASTPGSTGSSSAPATTELRRAKRGPIEIHVDTIERDRASTTRPATWPIATSSSAASRRLSAEHRAVLVVHHYLGLPDAEAATVLDVPIGTYKSRLNRAHLSLRAALEADERVGGIGKESVA